MRRRWAVKGRQHTLARIHAAMNVVCACVRAGVCMLHRGVVKGDSRSTGEYPIVRRTGEYPIVRRTLGAAGADGREPHGVHPVPRRAADAAAAGAPLNHSACPSGARNMERAVMQQTTGSVQHGACSDATDNRERATWSVRNATDNRERATWSVRNAACSANSDSQKGMPKGMRQYSSAIRPHTFGYQMPSTQPAARNMHRPRCQHANVPRWHKRARVQHGTQHAACKPPPVPPGSPSCTHESPKKARMQRAFRTGSTAQQPCT